MLVLLPYSMVNLLTTNLIDLCEVHTVNASLFFFEQKSDFLDLIKVYWHF